MRRTGLAAAAALTLVLTGCSAPAPEARPTASTPPPPAATSPAAPSPAPTATTPALVVPDCDRLVPLDVVQENFTPDAVLYDTPGELDREQALGDLDPLAQTTLAAAENAQFCDWIVEGGSDGGVAVFTSQVEPSDREELVAALESSEYTPVQLSGATAFGREWDAYVSLRYVVQAFVGSAWVVAVGSGTVDHGVAIAQAAVDSLREVNPQLAG